MQFGAALQAMILQWLYSNQGITLDVLANNINKPLEELQAEVDMMVERDLIRVTDGVIEILPDGIDALDNSNVGTEIVTRYTYQKAPGISGGRIIPTSRDFCRRLVSLNRVYTREDIDQISNILKAEYNDPTYDAWKRRGGWMTVKGSHHRLLTFLTAVTFGNHNFLEENYNGKLCIFHIGYLFKR
jgi:hypothetical protein